MNEPVLVPEYMTQFKCIGAECEDTCCAFWNISIDKETYKRYQKVDHPELVSRFKTDIIVRNKENRTESNYANTRHNQETGDCSFLEGGLCTIQAKLGEEYLSRTCATYPRRIYEVNGSKEISATLSCPEAARMVLLNPDGIEFTYISAPTASNMSPELRVKTDLKIASEITRNYWDLRVAAIQIVQNRQFSVEHRLMLLAVLADRIDEHQQPVPEIIESFHNEIENGGEITNPAIFPVNHAFQLRFLNDLLVTVYEKKLWHNVRYKQCLDDYLNGIQTSEENRRIEEVVSHYEKIHQDYYLKFSNKYAYIFENYLVNTIFSTLFPISGKKSMLDQVMYLGIMFSLIRMHLIGISATHHELTTDISVKLIQSFSKNFEHSSLFKKEVKNKCDKEKVSGLGPLSLIVMY